jgi:hypothetical protein
VYGTFPLIVAATLAVGSCAADPDALEFTGVPGTEVKVGLDAVVAIPAAFQFDAVETLIPSVPVSGITNGAANV